MRRFPKHLEIPPGAAKLLPAFSTRCPVCDVPAFQRIDAGIVGVELRGESGICRHCGHMEVDGETETLETSLGFLFCVVRRWGDRSQAIRDWCEYFGVHLSGRLVSFGHKRERALKWCASHGTDEFGERA